MHAFVIFSANVKTSMPFLSFAPTLGYCNHLCGFVHDLACLQKNYCGNTCALQCRSLAH